MSPNRIAVMTHVFPRLTETFVVNHVDALVRRGFEVHAIAYVLDHSRTHILPTGVILHELPIPNRRTRILRFAASGFFHPAVLYSRQLFFAAQQFRALR